MRSRLELASVELAEERDRIQQQLTLLVAAMAMFMFAVLFVATWVIVYFWDIEPADGHRDRRRSSSPASAQYSLSVRSQAARAAADALRRDLAELERDRVTLWPATRSREPKARPRYDEHGTSRGASRCWSRSHTCTACRRAWRGTT